MKKLLALILALGILLCVPSCKEEKQSKKPQKQQTEVSQTYTLTDYTEIEFSHLLPDYLTPASAWDAMGTDDNGTVYFGWTCYRTDVNLEDFAFLSYNPKTGKVKFIDTFMECSRRAGNLERGEAIPKGHTRFLNVDGKIYLASQGFHDFKEGIETLGDYRGAHIYCYDPKSEEFTDLSAEIDTGIVCENEGILALNVIPERKLLVGLTHPLSNLVFFNYETNEVEREVAGIPWSLGNPLSREIVIVGDKVYMYRGVEDANNRHNSYPIYCYDYEKDELTKTKYSCYGGFWNGQVTTSDNKTTYISTSCGELYKLDRESGKFSHLSAMNVKGEGNMGYVYSLNFSPDESQIFYIPTMYDPSGVYAYDIATNTVSQIGSLPKGVYTGNAVKYDTNKYFYASFSTTSGNWEGDCKMLELVIE